MSCIQLLSSCTIKEDRSPCPCLLMLDFNGTDTSAVKMAEVLVMDDGTVLSEDVVDISDVGKLHVVSVPRRPLHLKVRSGVDGTDADGILRIPLGQDCPKVYMYDSDILPEGERCDVRVRMCRNHCRLKIRIEGEDEFAFGLRLEGNVAGYDADGLPMPGEFSFRIPYDGLDNEFMAVLPRQTDASLMLHIDDGEDNVKAFALGRYIVSGGYDWTASDLEDISVSIDFAQTELSVTVGDWESVYNYEVEI